MAAKAELLEELQRELKDERARMLIEEYLRSPNPSAIATKALELLAGAVDEIEQP